MGLPGSRKHGQRAGAASGVHRVPCLRRLCDARDVDWAVAAFIAGLAILLAIALGIILDRNRQLDPE